MQANKTGFLAATENQISRRPAKGFPLATEDTNLGERHFFGETVSWSECKDGDEAVVGGGEVKLLFGAA